MTIPTHLITNALNLTGKTIEDIENTSYPSLKGYEIEKFCFYLLSPEFIEKYRDISKNYLGFTITDFGFAIYEYQRKDKEFPDGNPGPLIDLLTKIPGN